MAGETDLDFWVGEWKSPWLIRYTRRASTPVA